MLEQSKLEHSSVIAYEDIEWNRDGEVCEKGGVWRSPTRVEAACWAEIERLGKYADDQTDKLRNALRNLDEQFAEIELLREEQVELSAQALRVQHENSRLRGEKACLGEDMERHRSAIRSALDTMNVTDRELGEGGIARKAYAELQHAYYSIPADRARATLRDGITPRENN